MANTINSKRVLIPTSLETPPELPADAQLRQLQGATMGTHWTVKLMVSGSISPAYLQLGIERQLAQVVAQMSHWESHSNLCKFNHAAAGTWHVLPAEFFQVLDYALYLAQQTAGAYDPSIGKLVDLWGFGPKSKPQTMPNANAIAAAMQDAGWQRVQVDRLLRRVRQPGGLSLDLSSIAKGYAVDQVARWLQSQGVVSYLIEVGGELRGYGIKQDQQPWWVELEHPATQAAQGSAAANDSSTILALHGWAIATSGDYRQQIQLGDRNFSHSIDPRSGYPLTHSVASVTVLHAECMVADALATALMVMGLKQGMAYAEEWRLACRFISKTKDGYRESMSQAMRLMLS
ncbi:FAD:protein FMN transferase [Undibacterium sp. Ren11W]|uniref:FAD:protein FMN transferase n=1 Tax=Undibacterium sp. Ren11W TaxID=3413045 RepID=UPI003BF3EFCF